MGDLNINSIISFYPLTNQYISDNRIIKITESLNNDGIKVPFESTSKLRKYNFSSKFDFIRSQYPSLGYYLLADSTAPKASQCGTGCLRCWNAGNNCYECAQGYLLTLQRACHLVSGYYFKTHCIDCSKEHNDVLLKIDDTSVYKEDVTNPITVTFWIKVIGFVGNDKIDIINYSDNDFLSFAVKDIKVGDEIKQKKGLSLISGNVQILEKK